MQLTRSQKELTLIPSFVLVKFKIIFKKFYLFQFQSFSGVFRGGAEILLRAKLALADGVTLQLTVRSTDQDVAEIVSAAIG